VTPLTIPSQTSPQVRARRKTQRRVIIVVASILFAAFLTLKPPFVIAPLPDRVSPGSQPAETAAAKFVDPIWTSKVLPAIQDKAQDIAKLLPEIRADPESAGQKYGRRVATNPFNYMVKGTGKVIEIHTDSQAGTAILEIPGLDEKVALQIGPVVRGTAARCYRDRLVQSIHQPAGFCGCLQRDEQPGPEGSAFEGGPDFVAGKNGDFFWHDDFRSTCERTCSYHPGQNRAITRSPWSTSNPTCHTRPENS